MFPHDSVYPIGLGEPNAADSNRPLAFVWQPIEHGLSMPRTQDGVRLLCHCHVSRLRRPYHTIGTKPADRRLDSPTLSRFSSQYSNSRGITRN